MKQIKKLEKQNKYFKFQKRCCLQRFNLNKLKYYYYKKKLIVCCICTPSTPADIEIEKPR